MYLSLLAALVAAQPTPELPDARLLRRMLSADCNPSEEVRILIDLGPRVFPLYERVLDDPKATRREVSRVFHVLALVQADRGRFLEHAVAALVHPDWGVRSSAVRLLAHIGAEPEAVAALLFDGDGIVANAAATTLSKIGGRRGVTAIDIWLRSGTSHRYKEMIDHVTQCRDKLKRRLDAKPAPAK